MPWSETSPMDQKTQFIADVLRGGLPVVELCDDYGISRKTGYKWIDRYLKEGPEGLRDRSRRPAGCPNGTSPELVQAIIDARRRHPSWGAKKLLKILHDKHPRWSWPQRSTVCEILKRNGLVTKKRRRRAIGHPGKPTTIVTAPNDLWCADYKGQFKTGDGRYCYPLTVTDDFSRYLIGCQGLLDTSVDGANPVFTRPVQRVRLTQPDPHRQRRALRHSHVSAPLSTISVVGSTRRDAGAHRARQASAERSSRAHAPNAQGRSDSARTRELWLTAAPLQHVPSRVQRRAAA